MQVKGSAVKTVLFFVQKNFPQEYGKWLISMPEETVNILSGNLLATLWYPLQSTFVMPLTKICDLFYDGKTEGASVVGEFSAQKDLAGLYRFFIRQNDPNFFLSNAHRVTQFYFQDVNVVSGNSNGKASIKIGDFLDLDQIIEAYLKGFFKQGLEMSGCVNLNFTISKPVGKHNRTSEFSAQWD